MPELEDDGPGRGGLTSPPLDDAAAAAPGESIMDLDLDVYSPWPLMDHQLHFAASPSSCPPPTSPARLSVPSPADPRTSSPPPPPQGSASPIALDHHNSETEAPTEDSDREKLPSPYLGLTAFENPDGYRIINERMTQALRDFKESTEQLVLAQVWAPVKNGGRYVLTTSGQPFVLGPNTNGLHQYRIVSMMYLFSADGGNDEELGLPSRVFQQKLPEWTPNVQYYTSKEYSRLDHALHYNVQGTLALPVFEPSGQSCVGVLELIMTSRRINYAPVVDKVCKALEIALQEFGSDTIRVFCKQ
ncbi:protein NLP6 isoform X2 [Eucalyptus grandis]|uniref:protein NLP6 isoform X2 n=1 Tax=Eucalyptus grandis TaxID=71139 RepID=UPI00192EFFAE|nr:protein NLP6 isoform X2 [Eucalyptus grandis]